MNLTKEKHDAFCEMMGKELDKLGCSICYKTDTDAYIDTFGFIGYMRYEEDEDPTLIYHTEQGIEYKYID